MWITFSPQLSSRRRRKMVGFADYEVELRHALAHAPELKRRCLVNGQPAAHVARLLGLRAQQTQGAVRLLKRLNYMPSPERLALVVMRDWGLDDADIAEIFSRSKRWAKAVRDNADEIKANEPIPERLEFLECGLQRDDVPPEELYKRAAELRAAGVIQGCMVGQPRVPVAMHVYSFWNNYALVPVGTR
jgi:hypothetical protein